MNDIENALNNDEARRLMEIETAIAAHAPEVPPMHRRSAALALRDGATTIRVVVDGQGNAKDVDLTPAARALGRRVQVVIDDPDQHAAEARHHNEVEHERRMRAEKSAAVSKLWLELQAKAASLPAGKRIEDLPELWPGLARYTNLRLEIALQDTVMQIADKLGVSATWVTGLPALLANSPRSPARAEVPFNPQPTDHEPFAEHAATSLSLEPGPAPLPPPPNCASSAELGLGSVVILKSGGPAMVIEGMERDRVIGGERVPGDRASCVWFSQGDASGWCGPMRAEFALALLRPY